VPEFVAHEIQRWLATAAVRTLYIQKASPWENGYVESFNGKLRDELLDRELFVGLDETRCVLDEWRLAYNHHRPHSGIGWQTPAAYAAKMTNADGMFPAASPADPPVGAAPLPAAQQAINPNPILSH
jgi:transposase InsO family protein